MGSAEDVKAEDLQHLAAQDEEDPEELLTSLVGVMQAIISLYAVEDDMIR